MGDLEAKLELQPVLEASTSGRVAPFALYFPSGFSPSQETGCKWELQANNAPNADHYIIGRMVRPPPSTMFQVVSSCFTLLLQRPALAVILRLLTGPQRWMDFI